MLGVFICKKCGLVQLKNPAKMKQQLKEEGTSYPVCPKCEGCVEEADISYADYSELTKEEREDLSKRYMEMGDC